MIIKTKELQDIAAKITSAIDADKAITSVELNSTNGMLYLSITNGTFYVSTKMQTDATDTFRVSVPSDLFLPLVAELSSEDVNLSLIDNHISITTGKSHYKCGVLYERQNPVIAKNIAIKNLQVDTTISSATLESIYNVNRKEIAKLKFVTGGQDLQHMYYLHENGCFTFAVDACINNFTIDQPLRLLLTDQTVKLFKLFKDNEVRIMFGLDTNQAGLPEAKLALTSGNTYMATLVTSDKQLLDLAQVQYEKSCNWYEREYPVTLSISAKAMTPIVNRLLSFNRRALSDSKALDIDVNFEINASDNTLTISDKLGNSDALQLESDSAIPGNVKLIVHLADFKYFLEGCKTSMFKVQCGLPGAAVLSYDNIITVIPVDLK